LVSLCLCGLLLIASRAWASLSPDQIVLIANKNVPQSLQLADYYMAKRNIPQGRILLLDLPAQEQISYEEYQKQVVPAVRQFLSERQLKDKVTCLVTFYGVPFRIAARPASKADTQELALVRIEAGQARRQLQAAVDAAQRQAAALATPPTSAPASAPATDSDNDLANRAENAMRAILRAIGSLPPGQRPEPLKQFAQTLQQLGGPAAVVRQFAASQIQDPKQPKAERKKWADLRSQVEAAQKEMGDLGQKPATPDLRRRQRELVQKNFGLLAYLRLLESQQNFLSNQETASALDNELALLWWEN
jgi:hypothetical protein